MFYTGFFSKLRKRLISLKLFSFAVFESGLIVFWVVYFELMRIAPLFTYYCSFPNKSPGDHKWTANLKLIRYSNLSKTKHFSQSFKNIESTTLITKEEKKSMPNSVEKIDIFNANKIKKNELIKAQNTVGFFLYTLHNRL